MNESIVAIIEAFIAKTELDTYECWVDINPDFIRFRVFDCAARLWHARHVTREMLANQPVELADSLFRAAVDSIKHQVEFGQAR